jgi:hypothetical protein
MGRSERFQRVCVCACACVRACACVCVWGGGSTVCVRLAVRQNLNYRLTSRTYLIMSDADANMVVEPLLLAEVIFCYMLSILLANRSIRDDQSNVRGQLIKGNRNLNYLWTVAIRMRIQEIRQLKCWSANAVCVLRAKRFCEKDNLIFTIKFPNETEES